MNPNFYKKEANEYLKLKKAECSHIEYKKVKNNLDKIFISFEDMIFSPKNIIELLNVSKNTATNYIDKLKNLNLLDKIEGLGQSKYKFK